MNKPKTLRDVDRALIQTVMFQAGILPMEKTDLDMRRLLQQLPPDEARILRRKFRKMWRKAMADSVGETPKTGSEEQAKKTLGVGKQVPSRAERNARKQLVFDRIWRDIIAPLVKVFDNPNNADMIQKS